MIINWQELWDTLRSSLSERTTWGRNQILDLMNRIEQDAIRKDQHKEPLYAIAVEESEGEFAMTHGPTPNLSTLLEIVPTEPLNPGNTNSVIVLLNEGLVLFRWSGDEWFKF